MTSIRKKIFSILTVVLSLVAVLAPLELALRLFEPKYHRFNEKSQEYYTNPRGYHYVVRMDGDHLVYSVLYNFTTDYYRLPRSVNRDHAFEGKSYDILGLGDSFAFGTGVKYDDLFLVRLEDMLARSGRNLRIKNCAVPGANIGFIFETCLKETRSHAYPLVIYGFVLNDLGVPDKDKIIGTDFIDQNNGGYTYNPWRKRFAIINFICTRIEKTRLNNVTIKAYLKAFEPENATKKLKHFKGLADHIKEGGGHFLVVIFPLLYDFSDYPFAKCHEVISEFCAKNQIQVLDLLPAFSKHEAKDLWVNPTDHHPNEKAHQIAAEELFRVLENGGIPE